MRKLRHGELKELDQGHIALKWQGWALNPKLSGFKPLALKL